MGVMTTAVVGFPDLEILGETGIDTRMNCEWTIIRLVEHMRQIKRLMNDVPSDMCTAKREKMLNQKWTDGAQKQIC